MRRTLYAAATILPWLALGTWTATHMLWFVQRPWPVRMAAWVACAAWSAAVAWRESAGGGARTRPVLVLAACAAALGLQGSTFGLSPAGVVVSVGLSAAAAMLWRARFGGRTAGLKAVAVTLATVLTVGATESALRVLRVGQTARETDSRELARRFNNLTPPGSAFVNQPGPLDEFPPALIEINSAGTRGPEISTGPVDLLLLGDSFVESRQLPWEQTIGPRLQSALGRLSPGVRVVAHGMRGWSPLLEWNWYLKVGRRFQPRVVLLFFFWNDLWVAGSEAQTFRVVFDAQGRPDHFDAQVDPAWLWYKPLRLVRVVDEVVRLTSAAGVKRLVRAGNGAGPTDEPASEQASAEARGRRLAAEPPLTPAQLDAILQRPLDQLDPDLRRTAGASFWPGVRPLDLWSADQRAAAGSTERELASFAADVAADGGRLVIVYVPNPLQVGASECSVGRFGDRVDAGVILPPDTGVQAWLRDVAARHQIEFLDPSGEMRQAAATGSRLYLRADCHWSPAGHQFMADWLARWHVRTGRR